MRRVALACTLAAGACMYADYPTVEGNPTHVVDTSGAPFAWVCNDAGTRCFVESEPATPPPPPCPDGQAAYSWSMGRFVEILAVCAQTETWYSSANLSRPVACVADSECPQFLPGANGPRRFECRSGVCQNADVTRYPVDVIDRSVASSLCFAPFPRSESMDPLGAVSLQVSEWLASACDSALPQASCTLPLPGMCWQP